MGSSQAITTTAAKATNESIIVEIPLRTGATIASNNKTYNENHLDPIDPNSMEPAPELAFYVTPPAPSYSNTPSHHQSTSSATYPTRNLTGALPGPRANITEVSLGPSTTSASEAAGKLVLDPPMEVHTEVKTPLHTISLNTDKDFSSFTMSRNNAITSSDFVLESPRLIEMQRFSDPALDAGALKSTTEAFRTNNDDYANNNASDNSSSFFSNFFAIPPSLAGRPRLSEASEEYVRREFERGPVSLMWSKQSYDEGSAHSRAVSSTSSTASDGWLSGWWNKSNPSAKEGRREEAMAQ
ncbi:hypothetical protein BX616_001017 [Lobosporangium transversale]|uniref:Uncharacterized protein n=1 Tax=Lobosporangium transversale TaxID=64571 RepID=A0A1Y2H2A4_9FUNG|nr:hypothetical protein BCR41DRAFT_383688 [Lobosporangium transversale]KAF9917434.1 hypothetical protein BX616_001017 [Lobosporangium transversale]ORZ27182.1 hypothetical protein BCR41DRAFT_383688 [Lobosporangium transversale]|eukprot:XP_021884909.1 hypothetical protein BCR41DRAFT_383688 [Lobosporangium transversale]